MLVLHHYYGSVMICLQGFICWKLGPQDNDVRVDGTFKRWVSGSLVFGSLGGHAVRIKVDLVGP